MALVKLKIKSLGKFCGMDFLPTFITPSNTPNQNNP